MWLTEVNLFQNPEWKVLLIEAGVPENYLMDIPLAANLLQFTEANWKYKTVPSKSYCLGKHDACVLKLVTYDNHANS